MNVYMYSLWWIYVYGMRDYRIYWTKWMYICILYDESMYMGGITESDFEILSSRIDLNCLINIRLKTGENFLYKIFLSNLNLKKFFRKSFIKWSRIKDKNCQY